MELQGCRFIAEKDHHIKEIYAGLTQPTSPSSVRLHYELLPNPDNHRIRSIAICPLRAVHRAPHVRARLMSLGCTMLCGARPAAAGAPPQGHSRSQYHNPCHSDPRLIRPGWCRGRGGARRRAAARGGERRRAAGRRGVRLRGARLAHEKRELHACDEILK
jgi:hypothetical protein